MFVLVLKFYFGAIAGSYHFCKTFFLFSEIQIHLGFLLTNAVFVLVYLDFSSVDES